MALNHKDEHYTQWTHTESGKVLNRRLHRIMVQRGDQSLVELTGPDLPDSILTFAGNGHKDLHEGYIYSHGGASPFTPDFRPKRESRRWRYRYDPDWPTRRDVIHLAIGLMAIGVLKLIATGSVFGGY